MKAILALCTVLFLCLLGCGVLNNAEDGIHQTKKQSILNGSVSLTPPTIFKSVGRVGLGLQGCTGVLLNRSVVLTAASCFLGLTWPNTTTTYFKDFDGNVTQGVVFVHPKWTRSSSKLHPFNVALIRLHYPVNITNYGPHFRFPHIYHKSLNAGHTVRIAGIGSIGACNASSNGIISYDEIDITHHHEDSNYRLSSTNSGICPDDIGGPMMIYTNADYRTKSVDA